MAVSKVLPLEMDPAPTWLETIGDALSPVNANGVLHAAIGGPHVVSSCQLTSPSCLQLHLCSSVLPLNLHLLGCYAPFWKLHPRALRTILSAAAGRWSPDHALLLLLGSPLSPCLDYSTTHVWKTNSRRFLFDGHGESCQIRLARCRDENGSETDRDQLYHFHFFMKSRIWNRNQI